MIGFERATCGTDGCQEPCADLFHSGCLLHSTIATARRLTPENFDRLREALSTTVPLTDEERRERRARAELFAIEWKARDLKRGREEARAAGATPEQITDAIIRGEAGVRGEVSALRAQVRAADAANRAGAAAARRAAKSR